MKEPSRAVSLGDVARAAGISTAAASYALRNAPGVSQATRDRVLQLAKELGYAPDAKLDSWMASMRGAKHKQLLPLVWFNHHLKDRDVWQTYQFLTPYLEGARTRSLELGYRLEEIWTEDPDLTRKRLIQILYHRGFEGVVVTHFIRDLELDWSRLAAVCLEGSLRTPNLDRVMTDHLYNFRLALEKVKEAGYRRIGVCFAEDVDENTDQAIRAAACYHNSTVSRAQRIEPLFYPWGGRNEEAGTLQIIAWLKRHQPEAVIGLSNHLIEWAAAAGLRVPEEMAVVHIATDDDVEDWAGVCSNRREIGAAAVTMAISKIRNRQFGVPSIPSRTLIRGFWRPGRTLLPAPVGPPT